MRIHVEWRLPTIIITLQDNFQPQRLHVEYSRDQDARTGEGRRVATIRPDHFRNNRAERTLWLEQAASSGFLLLFDARGACYGRRSIGGGVKCIRLNALQKAVSGDQIGLLEAKECLRHFHRLDSDPYKKMAAWNWSVRTVGDALLNGIDAERDCAIELLHLVPSALIEGLSDAFRNEGVQPSQLGDHARRLVNLLHRRASDNPRMYPITESLLRSPDWADLIDTDGPVSWADGPIREALEGEAGTREWCSAVHMVATRMPVASAYKLLIPQTYRTLDEQTRNYLIEQLGALIRRFGWQDVQERTDSLFSELINRSAFQFAQRSAMLAAFLDCVEKLQTSLQRQPHELQKLRQLLYRSAQQIGAWCNALLEPLDAQQVRTAARAASLCKNPQLQGALMSLAKRTGNAPSAQAALFRALGAIRAAESDSSEPLAQLLAGALRQADAEGRHAAALDALEQCIPYENSRTLLELVRDALEGKLPVSAEHTPRIIRLIGRHGLFDLNGIATDALRKSCLEHPEWRDAIMATWRAVPDPHFVRGRLLTSLLKLEDANLRDWLQYAVPADVDFAPLRDLLNHLSGFADLEQLERALLERLRRTGGLINDVVGGGVRLPERIADVNGFLSDCMSYVQSLNERHDALNRQIFALIQQGSARLAQQSALKTARETLQATRDMLNEQLKFVQGGISVSGQAAGELRNQLVSLRNSPNLDDQVASQLRGVENSLAQLQSGQADLSQQKQLLESALRSVDDQLKFVAKALERFSVDPDTLGIDRLTEERQRISKVISQLQPDVINSEIHAINERRRELQQKRDQATAEWNDPQRMDERRARLQARMADERRERLNQLRAERRALEGV